MRFWRSLSSGRTRASVLIDIGASSVAAAYVAYPPSGPALLAWAKRVPITPRPDEAQEAAMERALELIALELVTLGAPALARVAHAVKGPVRVRNIRVSLDAPWEETEVHVEEAREDHPFTFTRRMLAHMLEQARAARGGDGSLLIEQHVVGMRLNGYQTKNSIGKRARRASLIVVTSRIRSDITARVTAVLKRHLHSSHAAYTSGPTLRYQVLRGLFPHERDVLIVDSAGRAGSISLVRAGSLVTLKEFMSGEGAEGWVAAVGETLRTFATTYPLPHTILLVASPTETSSRAEALGTHSLGTLWLSNDPPKVIPVNRVPAADLSMGPEALPDTRLALLARYEQIELGGN